ncbi:MAG TPA: alpha/beta hydrolase [Thermoanaerobaculia bacterium]|nr:alpha/beta hydrolase [Thermoanaerobaculia bacterium]
MSRLRVAPRALLALALAACAGREDPPPTHRVPLAAGIALDVVERGDPAGETLLLLHGYGESWRSWEPVLPLLPPDLRVVAPSLRGHGDSDKPGCCYRQQDFVADALALLDTLGVERATWVGFSMGSLVAHQAAVESPDRVARLVLVGTAPSVAGDAGTRQFAAALAALREPLDMEWLRDYHRASAAGALPPALLETMAAESRKMPLRVWRAALAGMLAEDHAASLGTIRAPTLLIWGEEDSLLSPEERERMARGLPAARLVFQGRGHAVHWEDPERFARELVRFLGATPTGARSRSAP